MLNLYRSNFQAHPFHLVSPSPWPILVCGGLFNLTTSAVSSMHEFANSGIWVFCAMFIVTFTMTFWFRDIISEATFIGNHTLAVQRGINMGVALFIVSEALFFLAIFWAYFHSALSPTTELGAVWPPVGIEPINAFEIPLLNTVLLLSSGVTVTYTHHCIIQGDRNGFILGSIYTLILALVFTAFQALEYTTSSFTITDGVFGSSFYFGTGFHGLHVIIGTFFLLVAFIRLGLYHLTLNHHLGLEGGVIYWHFVDVVWIFLFLSVYYWGS